MIAKLATGRFARLAGLNVVGLKRIPRPNFGFGGAWYGIGNNALHIISSENRGQKPDPLGAHVAFDDSRRFATDVSAIPELIEDGDDLDPERGGFFVDATVGAGGHAEALLEKGAAELGTMVRHYGLPTVRAYMGHVQDNAAESVRRVIDRLHDSEFAVDTDQGATIRVSGSRRSR